MSDQFDPYHVWLGIPPEESANGRPNHYRLLGLRLLESDRDVISNALDQRLVFLRTFQAGKRGALSQKLLNEVSAAGVVLLNAEKKAQYDKQLSAAALPAARQVAEAAAQSDMPMSVIPLPDESTSAPQPTAPWPGPPGYQAPAAPAAGLPNWQSVPAPRTAMPARPLKASGAPKAAGVPPLVIGAAAVSLAIVITACFVGWWITSGPVAEQPRKKQPEGGSTQNGPGPDRVAKGEPVQPSQPDTEKSADPFRPPPGSGIGGNQAGIPPTTPIPRPAMPSGEVTAADKQIWLADAPETRVLRRMGNVWVDYRPREEYWYVPRPLRDRVGLWDAQRRIYVDLYDDRMELQSSHSAPAVVCPGQWIAQSELPEFARRPAATRAPDPLRWRTTPWHALVFDGHSWMTVPVPSEIAGPAADFTIEMWARFDPKSPESRLFTAGPLELHTLKPKFGIGGSPSMLMADLKSGPRGMAFSAPVTGNKWHHWALVRAGKTLRLFIDGRSHGALPLDESFALATASLLVGGRGENQYPNLRGMIREFRISKGARYSESFRPTLRFANDEQTLVLPKFAAEGTRNLEDRSGRGHTATRHSAQWLPLTADEGIVQAELPANHVDLMRAFSSSLHTVRGTTERTPAHAETTNGQGIGQVLIPYLTTADYDLELEVERREGEGGLLLGLVAGAEARPLALAVNAFAAKQGPFTGVLPADLNQVKASAELTRHAARLVTGQRHRIVVQVRSQSPDRYALVVAIDGQTVHQAGGTLAASGLGPALSLPQRSAMFWGSHDAKIRYHTMRLYPPGKAAGGAMLAGTNNAPPSVTIRPSPPAPMPPAVGPPGSTAVEPTPASAARLPVPAAADLARRVEDAKVAFSDQLKAAKLPAQKATLAKVILEHATNTKSDPTSRYVLLDLARKVFVQAAEVEPALAAARTLEQEFDVPENEILFATIDALDSATLPSDERAKLARTAIALADDLVAEDSFAQAERMSAVAAQSATKQRDVDLRKDIQLRRSQISRMANAWKGVEASQTLVDRAADDAAANVTVGKFRCFVQEDWETGTPHLAKGNDPILAEPAKLDIAATTGKPADQAAAGEAWLKLAGDTKTLAKEDRVAVQRRAKQWLTSAVAGLEGLDRVRIEKKLEELKDVSEAGGRRPTKSRKSRATALPGLVGRVTVANRDVGILVTYQPGYRISDADVAKLAAAAGVAPGESWRVDLVGVFSLAIGSRVEVRHIGGSVSGGVHTLSINNQKTSEIGDDRSKNHTTVVTLPAGVHLLRWSLTGGDLGTASMQILPIDPGGQPVPGAGAIQFTREMSAAARQPALRSEFHFGS